jgi:hypothetical protein
MKVNKMWLFWLIPASIIAWIITTIYVLFHFIMISPFIGLIWLVNVLILCVLLDVFDFINEIFFKK